MSGFVRKFLLVALAGVSFNYFLRAVNTDDIVSAVSGVLKLSEIMALADLGNADAQVTLGNIYHEGTVVERDEARAFELYLKAARQKNVAGQLAVARCYYGGRGVVRDYNESFNWFQEAALQGCAEAQHQVGCMCRDGIGVIERDLKKAEEWFKKAANNGVDAAKDALDGLKTMLDSLKA